MMPGSKSLRTLLSFSIAFLSPGFTAYQAAAQTISAPVTNVGAVSATGASAASVQASHIATPVSLPAMSSNFKLGTSYGIQAAPGVANQAAAFAPAAVSEASLAAPWTGMAEMMLPGAQTLKAHAPVAEAAETAAALGTMDVLMQAVPAENKVEVEPAALGGQLDKIFDGTRQYRGLAQEPVNAVPAVTGRNLQASGLSQASPQDTIAVLVEVDEPAPAPKASHKGWAVAAAILAGSLLLGLPALALFGGVALTSAASVAYLASIQPLATAAAALSGAVYGLVAARGKDGEPASAADILASVVRYGLLAGAGVFVLMDVTQLLFTGLKIAGITTLPAALATAALGQGAFQGKFKDTGTSQADRLMAVFPAVAAAVGLSVGVTFAGPLLLGLLVDAMAYTGLASALFASLYQPGKSPEGAPKSMARGFVMQALMSGLALTVASPYLALPFAALAAWGFLDVLFAAAKEVELRLPERVRSLYRRK